MLSKFLKDEVNAFKSHLIFAIKNEKYTFQENIH